MYTCWRGAIEFWPWAPAGHAPAGLFPSDAEVVTPIDERGAPIHCTHVHASRGSPE